MFQVMDGATEFTGKHTDFIKQARQMQIKLHTADQEGRTGITWQKGKLDFYQEAGTRDSKYTIVPMLLKGMKSSLQSIPNCD
jgi:hypothetical protein